MMLSPRKALDRPLTVKSSVKLTSDFRIEIAVASE